MTIKHNILSKRQYDRRHGFTLIEIMTATSMAALIVAAIYGTYQVTLTGSQRCQNQLTLCREAVSICDRLKIQLGACQSFKSTQPIIHDSFLLKETGTETELQFITSRSLFNTNSGLVRAYWHNDADGRLIYREQAYLRPTSLLDHDMPYQKTLELTELKTKLELKAIDSKGNKYRTWNSKTELCPQAIQISLSLSRLEEKKRRFDLHTLAPIWTTSDTLKKVVLK